MKDMLRHLLTGVDNRTYDIARVLWLLGGLQFLAMAGYAVIVNKQPFAPMEYGAGLGAMLTAGGIGVAVKSRAEPGGERGVRT